MGKEHEGALEGVEVTRREALKVGALTAAGALLACAGIGAARPGEALAHSEMHVVTDADGNSNYYWYDDGCGLTDAEYAAKDAATAWEPAFTAKGKAKGKKLKATDAQCQKIANLVVATWSSDPAAVAAGASLIANRFELHGKKYSSVYSYARKSGWFANAPRRMDKDVADEKAAAVVKAVLTQGKRTLPAYVDEHDLTGDVSYAKTGGKRVTGKAALKKKSAYKAHKTTVCNRYGSKYTFYGWLNGDVAGYTSAKARKKYGEGRWVLAN